jgi:hypothetical protein
MTDQTTKTFFFFLTLEAMWKRKKKFLCEKKSVFGQFARSKWPKRGFMPAYVGFRDPRRSTQRLRQFAKPSIFREYHEWAVKS